MANRAHQLGWERIGRLDATGRRSLWMRARGTSVELCAGREGDDAYVVLDNSQGAYDNNPFLRDLIDLIYCARFAAEWEARDGRTLERERTLTENQQRTGKT